MSNEHNNVLAQVDEETARFVQKLAEAMVEQQDGSTRPGQYQFRKFAAAKRAALDLKVALTKLTQFKSL